MRHSPEHQIMHAAKETLPDCFIPEPEFIRKIGISGGYKHIVDRPEFEPYRGKASGGVYYWGHPDSIAAMKEDGVLK